jgi:crotonobetainyl-CoA:carnitine CoA-transferase CaiB-like acyl-CoA transferase
VQEVGSSQGSSLRVLGHPVKYSDAPAKIRRRAPKLGEHTREVLADYGISASEIDALAKDKAIA